MADARQATSETEPPSALRRALKVGRKPLLGLLVIAATLLYLDRVDQQKQLDESAYPAAQASAPVERNHLDFTLSTLSGAEFQPRAMTTGGLSLLLFWSPTNPDSIGQVSELQAAAAEFSEAQLQVLILASGADRGELSAIAEQQRWRGIVLHDPGQTVLGGLLKHKQLPYYMILDDQGRALKGKRGHTPKDAKKLTKYLRRRLGPKP